jgi:hypothetical protein
MMSARAETAAIPPNRVSSNGQSAEPKSGAVCEIEPTRTTHLRIPTWKNFDQNVVNSERFPLNLKFDTGEYPRKQTEEFT